MHMADMGENRNTY